MKLVYTNATVQIKRRTGTTGNMKNDIIVQEGIPAFISDTGTTADHEQTYTIMLNVDDVTGTINPDTDTLNDGTDDYKVANVAQKEFHYTLRAIKTL